MNRSRASLASLLGPGLLGLLFLLSADGCKIEDDRYCESNAMCARRMGDGGERFVCALDRHLCVASVCNANTDCTSKTASRCPEVRDRSDGGMEQCQPCDPADATSCSHIVETRQNPDGTSVMAKLTRCVPGPNSGPNLCVECSGSADCPTERPICDGNACRGCADHNDCGGSGAVKCSKGAPCRSFVCASRFESPLLDRAQDGQCIATGSDGDVIYVREAPCSNQNDGLTPEAPKCDLGTAINVAFQSNRRYVRVLGGSYVISAPLDISPQRTLVLIGAPAQGVSNEAAKLTGSGVFLRARGDMTGSGKLAIDQFDITQGKSDTAIVTCDSSDLSVRGARLRGATPRGNGYTSAAIDLNNCNAVIQRNQIGVDKATDLLSHNDAVRARGTVGTLRIDGNLIAGNQGVGVNLSGATPARTRLRFNTVTANGRSVGNTDPSGVLCPGTPGDHQVRYSLVAGNAGLRAVQVFGQGSKCQAPDDANAINMADPPLSDSYRLSTTQAADYRDKASPTPEELRELFTRDIDNTPRPQGPAWDYGAHELR